VTVLTRAALRALPRIPLSVLPPVRGSRRRAADVTPTTPGAGIASAPPDGGIVRAPAPLDTFICVHSRDLGHLFELALRSYELNFGPKGRLFLISNDLPALREVLDRTGLGTGAQLMADDDLLSARERTLPGWYRQQIIKLRADQFCETESFCNLGADTLLLRPVASEDLIAGGRPILYYNGPHRFDLVSPDFWMDRWYEMIRLDYIASILQTRPTVARQYVDFIFDLFCFHREYLVDLNRYLQKLYGPDYFYTVVNELGDTDRKRFGEWTLYSTYLLDVIGAPVQVRSSAASFLRQVRNHRILSGYQFDSKVVHFVDKRLDPQEISRRIAATGLPLGRQLPSPTHEVSMLERPELVGQSVESTWAS
jgi:hypothetical protein